MWLLPATTGILLVTLTAPAFSGDAEHRSTCLGYIGVMNAAAQSQDPLGPQAYLDLADKMYQQMNKAAVEHHFAPLPLPDDEDSEARRGMVVVTQCQRDMSLKYYEAVAYAYIEMRKGAGLPGAAPN